MPIPNDPSNPASAVPVYLAQGGAVVSPVNPLPVSGGNSTPPVVQTFTLLTTNTPGTAGTPVTITEIGKSFSVVGAPTGATPVTATIAIKWAPNGNQSTGGTTIGTLTLPSTSQIPGSNTNVDYSQFLQYAGGITWAVATAVANGSVTVTCAAVTTY